MTINQQEIFGRIEWSSNQLKSFCHADELSKEFQDLEAALKKIKEGLIKHWHRDNKFR